MNTIELQGLVEKILNKTSNSLGVLACDELPKLRVKKLPAVIIVNTDPSSMPGAHWLAIYITHDRQGYFFDSFGNPPTYDEYPPNIINFLSKNCKKLLYSQKQVQDVQSTTCGEHCIFFLSNIQKGVSYQRVLNMYTRNLICNDVMVCAYVKKIHPNLCRGHKFTCVQYVKH